MNDEMGAKLMCVNGEIQIHFVKVGVSAMWLFCVNFLTIVVWDAFRWACVC